MHGDGGGTKRVNEEELPEGCALDPMIYVYELPPQFNTWLVADPDNGTSSQREPGRGHERIQYHQLPRGGSTH